MNDPFEDAVKKKIKEFNETRGRRKELNPKIVRSNILHGSYKKYGRILRLVANDFSDIPQEVIDKMASAAVKTMLKRRPRPSVVDVALFLKQPGDFLFRIKIPCKRMNTR